MENPHFNACIKYNVVDGQDDFEILVAFSKYLIDTFPTCYSSRGYVKDSFDEYQEQGYFLLSEGMRFVGVDNNSQSRGVEMSLTNFVKEVLTNFDEFHKHLGYWYCFTSNTKNDDDDLPF